MSKTDFENAVRRIRNTALPFTAAVNVCKGIFERGETSAFGDRAAMMDVVEAARLLYLRIGPTDINSIARGSAWGALQAALARLDGAK